MDDTNRACAAAVSFLARRDRSEAELTRKLADKGFAPTDVEQAIARLKETGYLDDRRFARLWAESALRNGRGFGPRIRQGLLQRGLSAEIATEVITELAEQHDETGLVRELVARKFPSFLPNLAGDRETRRVMHYLQRRGFSPGAIFTIFRELQGS